MTENNYRTPNIVDDPDWLNGVVDSAEASRLLGISVATLNTWRSRGGGPEFIKVGCRAVRYQRKQLMRFLTENRRISTSDRGANNV